MFAKKTEYFFRTFFSGFSYEKSILDAFLLF